MRSWILYCGLRPIRLFHEAHSPLKGYKAGEIDFLDSPREHRRFVLLPFEQAIEGRERGSRHDAHLARSQRAPVSTPPSSRHGNAGKHVTLVDKANVLPSMAFFRRIFDEIAEQYPDVQTARAYVDAASLYLVQRPQTFDVIVTENMFGDILSDLAAGLVGGMGMAPSADIGEESRRVPAVARHRPGHRRQRHRQS